jgi:hypothetical protein
VLYQHSLLGPGRLIVLKVYRSSPTMECEVCLVCTGSMPSSGSANGVRQRHGCSQMWHSRCPSCILQPRCACADVTYAVQADADVPAGHKDWSCCAGSHTAVALVNVAAAVTIVDDVSNSFLEVLERMKKVLGDDYAKVTFAKVLGARSSKTCGHLWFVVCAPSGHQPCAISRSYQGSCVARAPAFHCFVRWSCSTNAPS